MLENQIKYKGKVIFFDDGEFWVNHWTEKELIQICFNELWEIKNYIDEQTIKNN